MIMLWKDFLFSRGIFFSVALIYLYKILVNYQSVLLTGVFKTKTK